MRRLVTTFLLVFATWLILTFTLEMGTLFAGVLVSLSITLICRHLLSRDTPRIILHPVKWFWLIAYLFVMLYAEVLAHLDVAARVFTGRIKPAIVEVPVESGTLLGKTLFGNSITITPGTLTVDTGNEERFYIHTIAYSKDKEIGRLFNRFGPKVIT